MGRRPVYVDLDVGQGSIAVPGSVGKLLIYLPIQMDFKTILLWEDFLAPGKSLQSFKMLKPWNLLVSPFLYVILSLDPDTGSEDGPLIQLNLDPQPGYSISEFSVRKDYLSF